MGSLLLGRQSSSALTGMPSFHGIPAHGVVEHAAKYLPSRSAIISGDRSWSFLSLHRDCIAAAAMLQSIGVVKGDRVGILMPNIPEYTIAANAIWRAGGVAVAISPLLVAEEVHKLLKQTDCRTVICLDLLSDSIVDDHVKVILVSLREHLPAFSQLGYLWMRHKRTGAWTFPRNDRRSWFWDNISRNERPLAPVMIDPEADPAYILPTGGTTDSPKAVTLSHRNLVANAWQQFAWAGRSFGTESMLAVLPFFHSYGMSATLMSGAMMAATLHMHHRFNTRKTIAMIEESGPSIFHAVPAMLVAMNERFRMVPLRNKSIRWVISGGAPLDQAIGDEFADHTGAHVVQGYGLSEASPVTHVGDLFHGRDCTSIGYPLPGTTSRIESPDAEGVGELIVKGPQVMLGYWNDVKATQSAIRNGWLHTGDLAQQERDGTFRIVGRKKDLIITSGFNVFPTEVEAVLLSAEGVAEAAVVAAPDERRGEVVKAFVVMETGAGWDQQALEMHCAEHLAKHKRPKIFEHCKNGLPRNFLGKVIRRQLREKS